MFDLLTSALTRTEADKLTPDAVYRRCFTDAINALYGTINTQQIPLSDTDTDAAIRTLSGLLSDTPLGDTVSELTGSLLRGEQHQGTITAGTVRQQALTILLNAAGLRASVVNTTYVTPTPFGAVAEYPGRLERVAAPGENPTELPSGGYYAQLSAEGFRHPTHPGVLIRTTLITVQMDRLCGTTSSETDQGLLIEINGTASGSVPPEDRILVLNALAEDEPESLEDAYGYATNQHLPVNTVVSLLRARLT